MGILRLNKSGLRMTQVGDDNFFRAQKSPNLLVILLCYNTRLRLGLALCGGLL